MNLWIMKDLRRSPKFIIAFRTIVSLNRAVQEKKDIEHHDQNHVAIKHHQWAKEYHKEHKIAFVFDSGLHIVETKGTSGYNRFGTE
jgi:hypothetical protein